MSRRNLLWAVLAAVGAVGGSLAIAGTQRDKGYTCPVTGEQLPCEKCCPLKGTDTLAPETKTKADAGYVCPLSGETLNCPKCCPLNQKQ